jgi:NAD(P)-dependent dehydrogenase (short-subunit alcohol dehydrogenase family)
MVRSSLRGLVAVVTGVAAPPGQTIALGLRRCGATVASDEADAFAAPRRGRAAVAPRLPLDPTDDLSWEAALFDVIERFGRLDIVVNAAGAAPSELGRTAPGCRLFATNLAGACRGTLHALHAMRPSGHAGGGGVIVNLAASGAGAAAISAAALRAASEAADSQSRAANWGVRVLSVVVEPGLPPATLWSATLDAIMRGPIQRAA